MKTPILFLSDEHDKLGGGVKPFFKTEGTQSVKEYMKSETSRNVLLIALAIRLQRLVKNLPNNHISAERISRKSLAEAYFSDGLSISEDGARKKAARYMDEIEKIFGLRGSEATGYVMGRKFDTFQEMFEFWLEAISPPGPGDKRLHVMLSGLLHAISNAFNDDPIIVHDLAKQLKEKYGHKNIRDTNAPLNELFDNYYISSWLQLVSLDDESMGIDSAMDPLLLRLKPRSEVGDNQDTSINLARPGCIHVIFEHALSDLDDEAIRQARGIAQDVADSEIWSLNHQKYLPCILYREGKLGEIIITMRNLDQHYFEDYPVTELDNISRAHEQYIPFGMDQKSWNCFRQISGL